MGTSGRPSISKRQKEQARAERQREKAVKRQQRKLDRQNGVPDSTEAPPVDASIEPAASS
jgi:hypothetical protein